MRRWPPMRVDRRSDSATTGIGAATRASSGVMCAVRCFALLLVTLGLGGCVAQIPAETRSRLNSIAIVSLLGADIRHTDREWWQEPYVEEVCTYETWRNRRIRRCRLETRVRTVSRLLGVHVAPLTGLDVDAASAALFRDRVAQTGAPIRMVPSRFGAIAPAALAAPPTAEPGQLPPAMIERLRGVALASAADAVLVLQGECAGPAGGCWAASLERARQAVPYAMFSPWTPSGRFHAWLFDAAKGTIVARWSAPEVKLVRAGWAEQPAPPGLAGPVAGALDPGAAQLAAQAIRFGIAELADDFACAMQGSSACEAVGAPAR